MKTFKQLFSNELAIALTVLLYFGSLLTLSCIYNNIAFIGVGVIVLFIACCVGASLTDEN